MMLLPHELFVSDYTTFVADLYRSGNSTSPRLDHLRPDHDAHVYEKNGVKWIRADGNGISTFTSHDPRKRNWWKIPKGTVIPAKLKLVSDRRPGHEHHFMIAPSIDMLLSEFVMLVDQIRAHCIKVN